MSLTVSSQSSKASAPAPIIEILRAANEGYPDGYLATYFDESGNFVDKANGDSLARFVVKEIVETYDPESSAHEQFEVASRVVSQAASELERTAATIREAGHGR